MSAEERPSTPSGGGGKLETLSKEDLIKFAKRQTLLFSKAKAKIDELSKKTDGSGEIQIVLQQKDELEGQLNLTRQEKDQLAQEKDDVRQSRDYLQKEKHDICKELAEIKEKLEEVNEKYEEADEERLSAVEAYQLLQRTLEKATTDKSSQSNHVQELEEKVGQLTNQLVTLREENECLKMQHTTTLESVKAVQLEYQKLTEDHKSLSEQHQATCAELDDASTKKDKLIVNFKALKQKYLQMKKEMDGSRAESPASVETSPREPGSEENQLKEQLESLQKELEQQKGVFEQQKGEFEQQKGEFEQQKGEFEQQKGQLTQLRAELEEKSLLLNGLDSENSALKVSVSQLQEENDSFREQMEKSDQQLLQAQMSSSTNSDVRAECEASITEWKEKVERMRAEYEETSHKQQAEIATLNATLQQVTAVNDQSKERMEELVLGLGKESAGIISQYEEKMAAYETERTQLLDKIQQLSTDSALTEEEHPLSSPANGNVTNEPSNENAGDNASVTPTAEETDDVHQELQQSKTALEEERQRSKVLQDTVQSLSDTVKELEEKQAKQEQEAEQGKAQKKGKALSAEANGSSSDVIQLFEHIRVQGIDLDTKDRQIEELGGKVSELVNYSSKLKTKCKQLLDANDQLTATVEQQERRLLNDARGARNLELHFQETENNVNEQIAHFHEERDQMIARVQEYASDIDRLRSEMLPFKDQEKQCVRILFNGMKLLADHQPDEDEELPLSNLVGLAKLLVSTALKFKTQLVILARDHDGLEKSEVFMKKMTLSWRSRYEEQAWLNRNLKKSIAYLEKKIEESGGDVGDATECHTARRPIPCLENLEYVSVEDLEAEAARIHEAEITRLYKLENKREKEIKELQMEKGDLSMKIDALTQRSKADATNAESAEPAVVAGESSDSAVAMDVRPKVRAANAMAPQSLYVSKSAQTEDTGADMEDRAIQGLRETVASLRAELKESSNASDELAALKMHRSEEGARVEELTKQFAEATTSMEEKDAEIEYLLEVIQRHKSRIEQQKKSLEELDIQINKNSIQEKFQLQVGDTQQSKLQASLSAAFIELQKSNEERDALHVEVEKLQGKAVVVDNQDVQPPDDRQAQLDKALEVQKQLNSEHAVLANEVEELKNQHSRLVAELEEAKDTVAQKEKEIEELSENTSSVTQSHEEVLNQKESLLLQLNKLLDQLDEERKAFEQKKVDLSQKVSSAEDEAERFSTTIAELQKEHQEMEVRNAQLLKEYKDLEQEKDELAKRLNSTATEVEQSAGSVEELQKKHKDMEVQRDQLLTECKELKVEKENLMTDLSRGQNESEGLSAKIVELQNERDEMRSQHDELFDEKSSLSEKLQQIQDNHAIEISQFKTEKTEHVTAVSNLERVKEQLKEELRLLDERLITCQDRNASLERQVQQLEEEHSNMTQQLANDMLVRKDLQQEKDASKQRMDELRKQNADFCLEIDNLKLQNSNMEATIRDLNSTAKLGKESLEKECNDIMKQLKKELDQVKEVIKEREKTIEETSEKLSFHQAQNAELHNQVVALTEGSSTELLHLKGMLDSSKLETEKLQTVVESSHLEVEALNSSLLEERAQHKQSADEMTTELESATAALEALKKTEEANVVKMEAQQTEIVRLSNQVVDVQRELEQTRKDMMEMSSSSQTSATSEEMASNDAKVKELEDRANKFKLLALKAKKELVECKATIERMKVEQKEGSSTKVGEMQTLMANYQHLQQDFDRLQDDLDIERSAVSGLKGQLEGGQTTTTQLQGKVTELLEERENQIQSNNQLMSKVKELEGLQVEWNSTVSSLEKESDSRQMEINDLNKTISRMTEQMKTAEENSRSLEDKLRGKINELELKVHEARDELEQANKTMSKSSVMDLEIADFERTVSTLEGEVRDKVDTIGSLQQELEHQQQKCASLEQQLVSADEQRESVESRYDKLQQMLNRTKQELEDAKQQETETKTTDLAVRGELEILRQQYEDSKIEMSKMSAQRLAAEDKLKSCQDAHQRVVRTLENRNRALQSDLEGSRSETTVVQEDYDNYKVRVHSVLKQQQTRASVEAALESEKVEKEHIQEVLTQVKAKLQETSDKLQAALSENALLQDELDKLSLKYNKLTQDMTNKEGVWRQRVEQLMLENSTIAAEHSSSMAQMGQHTEIMSQTFKEQMKASQTEHEHQISTLNSRIGRLESEKSSLTLELQAVRQQQGSSKPEQVKPLRQHSRQAVVLSSPSTDAKYNVRESGEGMEHPNPSHVTGSQASQPQVGASNTLVGLEQLLTSADDDAVSVVSVSSTAQASDSGDEAKLKSKLHLAEKQLEHLRELLNDSEATCLRYNEQVKLLKQEIRRLESNQQRENSISNMEYLKNIVYKFTTLESGDERGRLLPVLNTMLKFTEEELSTLRKIALSGTDAEAAGDGQAQGSWSGYLHRWTGFSS